MDPIHVYMDLSFKDLQSYMGAQPHTVTVIYG